MTAHEVDTVVTVPCAGCGQPIRLTWTKSAEGHRIYDGTCFEKKEVTK